MSVLYSVIHYCTTYFLTIICWLQLRAVFDIDIINSNTIAVVFLQTAFKRDLLSNLIYDIAIFQN